MSPFLPVLKKDAKNVTHTTDGSPTSGLFILKAGVRVGRKVKQDVAGFSYKGGEWEWRVRDEPESPTIVTKWQMYPLGRIIIMI